MNLENKRIKSRVMFSYDGFRKDSKKKSRVKGIKFFHKLQLKFSKKEFHYLNCLKSDKPCAKTVVLHLERNADMISKFKLKKSHFKCLKLEVGSKLDVNVKSRFWKRVLPMATFFDYLSCQDITNFIKIFQGNNTKRYRKLAHFSFPVIPNNLQVYSKLFKKIKELHSLKMLSFNVQAEVEKSHILTYIQQLKELKDLQAIFINCHVKDPIHLGALNDTLTTLNNLKHISLQCGQMGANPIREVMLNNINLVIQTHQKITHLAVELYLPVEPNAYKSFLDNLEYLTSLKSLDLKLDCKKDVKFANMYTESQVIPNIKYLVLDSNSHDVGLCLAETILTKTKSLVTCNLRNIDITNKNLLNSFFKCDKMQEVQFSFDKKEFMPSLDPIFKHSKNFKGLTYFSTQIHFEETPSGHNFDFKSILEPLGSFSKLDTFRIEILFPIKLPKNSLRGLVSKLCKLDLVAFKLDLTVESLFEDISILELLKIPTLEILNVRIDNLKISKKIIEKIKEQLKICKKIVSCTLEGDNFKLDRTI